jgi:hypothetical protein
MPWGIEDQFLVKGAEMGGRRRKESPSTPVRKKFI